MHAYGSSSWAFGGQPNRAGLHLFVFWAVMWQTKCFVVDKCNLVDKRCVMDECCTKDAATMPPQWGDRFTYDDVQGEPQGRCVCVIVM